MNFMERFKKANWGDQVAIFAFIFILLFLRTDHMRISVEKNIYDFYSESIVVDHDLNVINQVPAKERWQITKSGNWPDVHSNGIINLWAPFFIYKSGMQNFVSENNNTLIFMARSFATAFYSVIVLLLTLYLLKNIFPHRKNFIPLYFLMAGTSFWWFVLCQPGNADITSAVIAALEIWLYFHLLTERSLGKFFIFGLLLSAGLALKIDHIFYLILPFHILVKNYLENFDWKNELKYLAVFSLGFVLNIIPMLMNDYVKFGFFNYGYANVVNFDYYVLWENLFYPSGFLNNCPIYIFCFVSMLMCFSGDKKKNIPLLVIGSIPVVALILESFARIHHESYGGRHWVPHFAIFAILITNFFEKLNELKISKKWFYFIYFLLFASVVQNINKLVRFILDYDHFFNGESQLADFQSYFNSKGVTGILSDIFYLPEAELKIKFMLPLVFVCAIVAWTLFRYLFVEEKDLYKLAKRVTIYLFISYISMTTLNLINNKDHFLAFQKTGQLDKAIIGNGPNIQALFENLGTYEKLIQFYRIQGDDKKVEEIRVSKKAYILKAASEIVHDKVGFKERLLNSSDDFISKDIRID